MNTQYNKPGHACLETGRLALTVREAVVLGYTEAWLYMPVALRLGKSAWRKVDLSTVTNVDAESKICGYWVVYVDIPETHISLALEPEPDATGKAVLDYVEKIKQSKDNIENYLLLCFEDGGAKKMFLRCMDSIGSTNRDDLAFTQSTLTARFYQAIRKACVCLAKNTQDNADHSTQDTAEKRTQDRDGASCVLEFSSSSTAKRFVSLMNDVADESSDRSVLAERSLEALKCVKVVSQKS